jgi:ribosome-associated protein
MGRRRGDDDDRDEVRDRPTRDEKSAGSRQAQELSKQLVAMRPAEWPFLGLDEMVVDALQDYIDIPSGRNIALQRQLRRVQVLLLTEDLDAVEAAMGAAAKGHTERQDQVQALERERVRIVEGGKEAEAAFVAAHPDTDRQRLRQLAGNVRKATGETARKRANRKLMDLLLEAAGLA